MILYPVFWAVTNFMVFGLCHWNSRVSVVGDVAVVCLASVYYRELFVSDDLVSLKRSPEFWITSGAFIFSCCEIPITGLINYFSKNYDEKLLGNLYIVLDSLNILLYSMIAYAFICPLLTRTKKF